MSAGFQVNDLDSLFAPSAEHDGQLASTRSKSHCDRHASEIDRLSDRVKPFSGGQRLRVG
jgi:hypothetical protein